MVNRRIISRHGAGLALMLALGGGFPAGAYAATYTVATNGSDSAAGTVAAPYRTIGKAVSRAGAGDTIQVRGGTYTETVIIRQSGTASAPIKLTAYAGESPVINGDNWLPGTYGAMIFLGGSYLQVSGFEVLNSNNYGVHIEGRYNQVRNLNVHHSYQHGILARGDNNLVENCRVWQNTLVNVDGRNSGNGNWGAGLSAARDPGNGITENSVFQGNVVYNNWGEGISSFEASGTVIDNNIVYDNWSANIYLSDTTNTTAIRNLIYSTPNNSMGRRTWCGVCLSDEALDNFSENLTVVNNFMYGNNINVIWYENRAGSRMKNVLVSHNTLVNGGNTNVSFGYSPNHSNIRFVNNIVLQEDSRAIMYNDSRNSALSFSSNLYSRTPPTNAASWNDVVANPVLAKVSGTGPGELSGEFFRLQSSSPARARATLVSSVTDDFFRNARTSTPDIGGHEFSQTSTPPPPSSNPTEEGNLALSRPVTVSSVEGSFAAGNAVDGNSQTRWSSQRSDDQWLVVDLGASYNVNRVKLLWEAAYGKSFQIQVSSDNANWATIYNTTSGTGGTQDLTGLSGTGRYVRVRGLARGTSYGYSLWEVQVYGTAAAAATSNLALNKSATVSSTETSAFPGKLAFDGNGGTRWSSQRSDQQWISVDLGATYNISRVKLLWEAAYARSYKIEVSTDGTNWTSIYSTSNGTGGTVDLTSVSGVGRHVRMYGTARGTSYGYSLWEMEVYGTPWQ